ncbi:unnamed protein product [Lactuca virosa]|uniref:Uncharacterized protein n=1 Tax=Lactuca virosa TaxID=75947 RepID=A0AAU9N5Y3_9ASTR|nr:unnamed protein product [Lactuca virosa]
MSPPTQTKTTISPISATIANNKHLNHHSILIHQHLSIDSTTTISHHQRYLYSRQLQVHHHLHVLYAPFSSLFVSPSKNLDLITTHDSTASHFTLLCF